MFAFSVKDIVQAFEHYGISGEKKIVLQGIIIITSWRLWKARNEKIFSNKEVNVTDIISEVKALGFLWYKHRARRGVLDWENGVIVM